MSLNIEAQWLQPFELTWRDGTYTCECQDQIPEKAGVYVFGRKHGEKVTPVYIGKALKLPMRIKSQLDSVKLMQGVRAAGNGSRFLMVCVARPKSGQKVERIIHVLESALIAHAVNTNVELLNKQGTKRPNHTISFKGNRTSEGLIGRQVRVLV